jgi:hypothetical protein
MTQQDPQVAERERLRRRNAAVTMVFALLLCAVGAVWAWGTLGQVGDRAAAELVPETTLPSLPPQTTAPPADGDQAAAPPPATPAPAPVPVTRFVSPSGNIACAISEQLARCDLADKSWDPGAPPAGCTQTYGAGVVVDAAGPRVTCAADSLVGGGGGTLGYGREITVGDFTCGSSEAGMRCAQTSTGLGFSVSRRAYTFF